MTLCSTSIVTRAIITIYTNSINAGSKTRNSLVGVVILIIVLCTIRDRTAASESVAAPTSGAVAIVEVRVLNLNGHVGRILYRCMALTPLYQLGVQVFQCLLQLSLGSIAIGIHCVERSSTAKAGSLGFIQALLQSLTGIVDEFDSIESLLQFILGTARVAIDSQLGSNIGTQTLSLFQSSLQTDGYAVAVNAVLISSITVGSDECLIRVVAHCLPVDGTFTLGQHVQLGIGIVTLPTHILAVEFGLIGHEGYVLETIGIAHLRHRPRVVRLGGMVNPR